MAAPIDSVKSITGQLEDYLSKLGFEAHPLKVLLLYFIV